MVRRDRPVSVDIGVTPKKSRVSEAPPEVCIVGIVTDDTPWFEDVIPRSMVRSSNYRDADAAVEHIRVMSREILPHLPSLGSRCPSRLRDAVRIALGAGARSIDLVLARVKGLKPWDLDKPDFVFAVDPFISNMLGTNMVYPDIGGPIPRGPGTEHDEKERVDRFVRAVKIHRSRWTDRYQVGLLDDPDLQGDGASRVLAAAASSDAALCRWRGDQLPMARHGWRSAASFVAGILASRPGDLVGGVAGSRAALEGGRHVDLGRREMLSLQDAWRPSFPEANYYVDVVPGLDDVGWVRTEPTLRAPVGTWSIPAMRVAKVIHWQILQAAAQYVFETADITRAVALAASVRSVLEPYQYAGVLVGPNGSSAPDVRGGVVRDPAAPGLRVEIGAQLKPWAHRVSVRVNLRQGSTPVLEEVA
jgi:hypothetical protein